MSFSATLPADQIDLSQFGGRKLTPVTAKSCTTLGAPELWNFGYVHPDDRSEDEEARDNEFKVSMPEFSIKGAWNDDPEKVCLWDCAKAANHGEHFIAFWQQTGSCVGCGGGQAVWYTSAVEVIRLRDPEQVILPFYLLPYGRSRYYGGLRGRGDGSFGSAFAKAITTDGIVPYNVNGLPQPTISKENGVTWGSNAEYAWSDGAAIQQSWLDQSRKHLIRTTSQCRNADQMWEGISNWYAATIASDWGGQMRPAVRDGVLLNRRVTTWQHQMSVIARWRHPTLGKLFYILNSWGPRTHGICPSGAAPGGFWVTFAEMDYICRNGEAFLFSQFDGFPAQTFEFDF